MAQEARSMGIQIFVHADCKGSHQSPVENFESPTSSTSTVALILLCRQGDGRGMERTFAIPHILKLTNRVSAILQLFYLHPFIFEHLYI
jgi:hypothetical protein